MKVLDPSMLDFVSGGRGNNGGDRSDNGGGTRGHDSGRDASTGAGAAVGGVLVEWLAAL